MAKNIYSVGQVNAYIKNMFTQDFMLRNIYMKGEVSNCKYHGSGHIFFSLKDETGAMACVMFAGERRSLKFRLEDGQKVIALGRVDVYERDGKYQFYAREIVQEGEGEQYRRLEQLKRELSEMGMFDAQFKKPIPFYSRVVGIVTSPTGAAVRDIMSVSYRRNPNVQLILSPTLVQGEQAAHSIAEGIRALDEYGVDVIIMGRGGGSREELWAFNEEEVARAIFRCRTPVISAVGHETDTTIADLVADLRVPTPSAAAEQAVVDYDQLMGALKLYRNQLADRVEQKIDRYRGRLENQRLRMENASPRHQLDVKRQYAAELTDRLQRGMTGKIQDRRQETALLAGRLDGCSPLKKLQQGYSYTETEAGKALYSIEQVKAGDILTIHVTDGRILARAETGEKLERTGYGRK